MKKKSKYIIPVDASLDDLLDAFVTHEIDGWKAVKDGPGSAAGKHSIAVWNAYLRILEHGDVGRERLVALFKHPHKGVRCSAAGYMLRYAYDEARPVLEEIELEGGLVSGIAQAALENWDKGTWKLDPPPQMDQIPL